jgi:hypothetical protein
MLKHANFDKIDHFKGHINSNFQGDHRIGTFIHMTTWDKRLIKTKKVPCVGMNKTLSKSWIHVPILHTLF